MIKKGGNIYKVFTEESSLDEYEKLKKDFFRAIINSKKTWRDFTGTGFDKETGNAYSRIISLASFNYLLALENMQNEKDNLMNVEDFVKLLEDRRQRIRELINNTWQMGMSEEQVFSVMLPAFKFDKMTDELVKIAKEHDKNVVERSKVASSLILERVEPRIRAIEEAQVSRDTDIEEIKTRIEEIAKIAEDMISDSKTEAERKMWSKIFNLMVIAGAMKAEQLIPGAGGMALCFAGLTYETLSDAIHDIRLGKI